MHLKSILAAIALSVAGAVIVPAHAQGTISVPANASWKHAGTGVILRSKVADLPRGEIKDATASELDVMVQYGAGAATSATLYLFRPALMSVPVWFDRSEAQILARDTFGGAVPQGGATAFAPPRGTATTGLRRVYVPGKGPYRSTGLAMMPLGDWLVAIRISSTELDPAALDAKMSAMIAGIVWPSGIAEGPAAVPVLPCARPLAYARNAKLAKPDMAQALLGAAIFGVATDKAAAKPAEPASPSVWCRESDSATAWGVYRADDTTQGYVMAVGDAGRIIQVAPGLPLDDKKPGFFLSLGDLDRTLIYPDFDKLPRPEAAFEAVRKTAPVSSVSRGGKDITISM